MFSKVKSFFTGKKEETYKKINNNATNSSNNINRERKISNDFKQLNKNLANYEREKINNKIRNSNESNLFMNYKFQNKNIEESVKGLRTYIKTQRAVLKNIDKMVVSNMKERKNIQLKINEHKKNIQ